MYLIAIAWIYVVLMMALAEALSTQGTVLGAVFTFLLYGALPLGIVLYIFATPARKRLIRERQAQEAADARATLSAGSAAPDGRRHAPGDTAAAERKEM
jgi:hypothetical protein